MRFRTLRGRLTALAVLAAIGAVALLTVGFNVVLAGTLRSDANDLLRSRAAAATTTVVPTGGRLHIRESPSDGAVDSYIWIYDGKRAIARPAASRAVQLSADALAGEKNAYEEVNDRARLYATPIRSGGRDVGTVVAGVSLAAYDQTVDTALLASVALGLLLIAAVGWTTWVVIGRALRPVHEMTGQAAEWGAHDIQRRFGPYPRPDELGELARTFDALLDRLAASLRHEERLASELSHELRTPLARILAEVEMLQRRERSADERREAYAALGRSAEQMTEILETLMVAARAEGGLDKGRSEVNATLRRVASELRPGLAERGVELEAPAAEGEVMAGVDSEVIARIVAPLLDNAGRYARGRVSVTGTRDNGSVVIIVSDDGPGVADPASIFEPGVRGAPEDSHSGAGLGLPLARRLARAAGGDVRLAAAPADGGAEFRVELPA